MGHARTEASARARVTSEVRPAVVTRTAREVVGTGTARPGAGAEPNVASRRPGSILSGPTLPEAWMGLQRLAGNRAVVHHLGSLTQVPVPVAQREIGDDVEEGAEIKIWDPDAGKAGEVVVVTFARRDGDDVLYHPAAEVSTKGSQAKKKANRGNQATKQKPLRVKNRYAFSFGTSNKEIEREVGAISKQEEKGVGASKAVITYVMGLLNTDGEKYGLDVKPDARKVVDVLNGTDDFRDFVEDKAAMEDLITGDQDYFVEKLVDAMRGESLAPVDSAPSKVGSSQPDWKSKKTIDLRNALVSTLEGKQGSEKLADGTTLAHKISRNRLGMMLTLLKKAKATDGTRQMWAFVGDVEKLTGRHDEEAIENWTANLELGPNDDYRASNPGAQFDGNYPGGLATPRTADLEEANLIIERASNPDTVDWEELAGLLAGAQASHVKITAGQKRKPDDLSLPWLQQWQAEGEGLYGRDQKASKPATVGAAEKAPVEKGQSAKDAKKEVEGPDADELVLLLRTNNCLINAIARQAGVAVSLAQLTRIRVGVGSIGEMLVANPKTVRIIMQALGLNRGLVVAYKDRAKSEDKTEKVPSEAFGNQQNPVIVVHNGRDHFISFDEAALEQELEIKKNGQ
jgi:hypothetical protein